MITLRVFDNGGKTLDRYSVIIGDDVYSMSHDANMPNGCNYYAGIVESISPKMFEYEVVDIKSLPESLLIAIAIRLNDSTYNVSIYDQCKLLGIETDHHESDLYVKKTPVSEVIVGEYEYKKQVGTFSYKGEPWYDIPFAFDPFWDDKRGNIK